MTKESQRYNVSSGIEEMPYQNMPVRKLNVATLPLDLPWSGLVTKGGGGILTTGKTHKKKPDGLFLKDESEMWHFQL